MAGVTATISATAFRADWDTHMPMRALCERYTITRDQVIRLRDVWNLPLRNDRRLRFKPKRSEMRDPTPREIAQACREIQAKWDERTREERSVIKTQYVSLRRIEMTEEALEAFHELEGE
ncbi:MAG: hypothetical protein EBS54_02065 [Betaproteobacteria bacterium]|nr:hypothetical protein [Betaproteobacteria bacterium]